MPTRSDNLDSSSLCSCPWTCPWQSSCLLFHIFACLCSCTPGEGYTPRFHVGGGRGGLPYAVWEEGTMEVYLITSEPIQHAARVGGLVTGCVPALNPKVGSLACQRQYGLDWDLLGHAPLASASRALSLGEIQSVHRSRASQVPADILVDAPSPEERQAFAFAAPSEPRSATSATWSSILPAWRQKGVSERLRQCQ